MVKMANMWKGSQIPEIVSKNVVAGKSGQILKDMRHKKSLEFFGEIDQY